MNNEVKVNKHKKDIAELERKFRSRDISSGFKLYQTFHQGVFEKNSNGEIVCLIEKDEKLADNYLKECSIELENTTKTDEKGHSKEKFLLATLNLTNFRKFKSLKLKLDKNLTVIIGENGSGKTTIVDAISKSLSWVGNNIVRKGGRGRPVTDYDVNINCQTYSEINIQIKIGNNTEYIASLNKTAKGAKNVKNSRLEALDELAGLYRIINDFNIKNNKDEINLPILVSYDVNRTNINTNKTFSIDNTSALSLGSRFDAYDKATDGTGNFSAFSEWFITLHNLAGGDLKERLDAAKKKVDALSLAGADQTTSELWEIFSITKSEYEKLLSEFNKKETYIEYLRILKNAITSTIPDIDDIFVDSSSGRAELKVIVNDIEVNVFQTSQGQHVFLSIIADITRRLIMLNPSLSNPLLGQGVVLIDEVELHLHPKWQQGIIKSLVNTFPNIQFILTTHSPQVLSTVDKSNIRQFIEDEYGNIKSIPPKFQTKGVASSDILNEIMHTNSIPDIEEAHLVESFSEKILHGDRTGADTILSNLISHFGEDHPIIENCQNKIHILEMKERIKQKKKEKKDGK